MKKILISILIALSILNFGFYTIQPIGAIPTGATALVWRKGKEPFFNSPDAMCLLAQNSVSLMCRMVALSNAPHDRIVFRLPYQDWTYKLSVNGAEFAK